MSSNTTATVRDAGVPHAQETQGSALSHVTPAPWRTIMPGPSSHNIPSIQQLSLYNANTDSSSGASASELGSLYDSSSTQQPPPPQPSQAQSHIQDIPLPQIMWELGHHGTAYDPYRKCTWSCGLGHRCLYALQINNQPCVYAYDTSMPMAMQATSGLPSPASRVLESEAGLEPSRKRKCGDPGTLPALQAGSEAKGEGDSLGTMGRPMLPLPRGRRRAAPLLSVALLVPEPGEWNGANGI